ncbi:hypothetical protein BUALT_Bualt08G0141800 [Buddleja alternifolia]|uniref:Protein NRT1/ PTR FAMILY 5.10-like n=1 Tax=Buddleja alternifolia TaxID=168488 RepID=A0AAV6X7J0_9LAMI|nr:hypothetical protein BUALT_Bualt08G0141800 [Buddleja alternifolia]
MAIIALTGDDISEASIPLLDDVVPCSVDFKSRPSVRSKSGSWKSAIFIIGVQTAERFSYYGISSNLVSYFTGALGQSTAAAAANLNAWYGTAALSPILGAFIADSFLGRYRTIIVSSLFYIMGLGFLTLSAAINSSNSSDCENVANDTECSPPQLLKIFFFFSLYLVAFAQGGFKPCVQAFGADQFDNEDEKESKAKSSFFNWWLLFSCLGIILAILVLSYIQENLSWELGFGIPCIVMCFTLIVFLLGSMTYRFPINSDQSNPFVRIGRVFLKAARNCVPAFTTISHEQDYEGKDVEDAKAILRLVPIMCASLGHSIVYAQPSTLFTKQAATMNCHVTSTFQIPAASFQSIISISIVVFIPFYDRVFVPIARAITKSPSGISMLQRVGTGLFLSIISIVVAAFVEKKRLAVALEYGLVDMPKATIPMSVLWLTPQFLLCGIANVFALVGLQEFFYDQVPSDLKSMGLALYLSILGIGSFLSSFLVSAIEKVTRGTGRDGWFSDNLNRAHLDYFYWLLAGISAFALAAYIYFAKAYVYSRKIIVGN